LAPREARSALLVHHPPMRRLLVLPLLCAVALVCNAQAPSAATRAEVEQFNRAFDDAVRKMSNEAILALWEDDGISLLPSTDPMVGKKAIATFLKGINAELAGARMEKFTNECHDLEITGSWASEWCTEHQIVKMPDDQTFDSWGKILLVLHRGADAKWRIRREMWNQAVPAAPEEKPAQ